MDYLSLVTGGLYASISSECRWRLLTRGLIGRLCWEATMSLTIKVTSFQLVLTPEDATQQSILNTMIGQTWTAQPGQPGSNEVVLVKV